MEHSEFAVFQLDNLKCLMAIIEDGSMDTDDLILGWIAHAEATRETRENFFWAWNALTELVSNEPERSWPIIVRLVEKAQSLSVLANVAAGPLEQLLAEHGPRFIDRVVALSKVNPSFRKCLRGVWPQDMERSGVWQRIDEAVKDEPVW